MPPVSWRASAKTILCRTGVLLKAVIGIGLLVAGALLAAQKIDRERGEEAAQDAAYARDPNAPDAVKPSIDMPGSPTQRPSR